MQGILEKLRWDAANDPHRVIYNFLDCEQEPFGEHKVTMRELYQRAMNIAAELGKKGAKQGDRALILSMQDEGTIYAVYGCMMAGVIFTLIPPPLDEGKLNRFISVLKSCTPKFLISNQGMEQASDTSVTLPLLRRAFKNVARLKRIYTDKVKEYIGPEISEEHGADDLLYLQYTSGSISAPKGVMVSYGNLMGCIDQVREIFDFTMGDHNLASWVPFYHNIGLVVAIFVPLLTPRGISYFIPTLQFLQKPTVWPRVLSDYKVDVTAAPNSAYDVCTKLISPEDAARYDLSHVTHLINGSEFVNAHTVEKFCHLFGISPDAFAPGYGLSECVCVATLSSGDYHRANLDLEQYREGRFLPVEHSDKAIVGVGRPAGDTVIVAVRPDGSPCDPGEIGEIYIQGSSVCGGYWKNPEETKRFRATVPGYIGPFYQTGDMGLMHQGQLYLTGRAKEMLVISGKNIFPGDITLLLHEQGLEQLDAVCAFSLQDERGELPVFCAETPLTADFRDLAAQINRIVAASFGFSFHDIVFVPQNSLPRTDNRKIRTLAARQLYEDGGLRVLYQTKDQPEAGAQAAEPRRKITIPALAQGARPSDIVPVIRSAFEKLLSRREFSPDESFFELGGDSLRMVELVCQLEHDLSVSLDMRQIAAAPTVTGISGYLSRVLSGEAEGSTFDLRTECVLEEDIRPRRKYRHTPEECKKILLTGSTGFLGAYLIQSLIRQRGRDGVTVYCHARAADETQAMERIVANMKRFRCWKEEYRPYIVPVPGDLNLPRLGLEPQAYTRLSREIDMVYHNGAVLNFIFPYHQMKRTNVTGTAECLRFACDGRPKYFHYVSSYSVYDNPSHFGKRVLESDPLDSPDGYFLGYSETKWVAEKLVQEAGRRGLRTAVYRPGDITGTLKDGIWKLEDLISRSLVGSIQLGHTPDIGVNLHLTPVDYVSDAIVHISFQSASTGKAFNLINHNLMPLRRMNALMNRAGYRVELLPYNRWCEKLADSPVQENALRILSSLFTDRRGEGENLIERYGKNQPEFDTCNTDELLLGSGITCPPVDAALLHSYLRYFQSCGHLPKPSFFNLIRGLSGQMVSKIAM